jgi:hypothetical protein
LGVSLDLRKAWRWQRQGDLMVVLTWVNDERALVLMPAIRRQSGWYVVLESAAYLWGVDHASSEVSKPAMLHAVRQAHVACEMLDMEPSKMNRGRVISVITSWIPDLCRMPSEPVQEFGGASFGEIVLRADGKPLAAEAIRQEDAGVSYDIDLSGGAPALRLEYQRNG